MYGRSCKGGVGVSCLNQDFGDLGIYRIGDRPAFARENTEDNRDNEVHTLIWATIP